MAKEQQQLYFSVNPQLYRICKSQVLTSQALFLNILKRLHTLEVLARQKRDLKKRLESLLSSLKKEVTDLDEKLPEANFTKKVQPVKEKIKIEEEELKHEQINEELMAINEKLKQLNALAN